MDAALCGEPYGGYRVHRQHWHSRDVARLYSAVLLEVGRNPTAIAITNDGDDDDADETVFVTQIFAELDPNFVDPFNVGGEVRDLGKQGVVHAFPAGNANPPITKITLSPLADSGFNANRSNFCPSTHPAHITPAGLLPETRPYLATDPVNANNPQGVFPNQLLSALIRGNRLYLPNIGAQPEPPETATTNVQALVHIVDTAALGSGDGRTRQPEPADRRGDRRASP